MTFSVPSPSSRPLLDFAGLYRSRPDLDQYAQGIVHNTVMLCYRVKMLPTEQGEFAMVSLFIGYPRFGEPVVCTLQVFRESRNSLFLNFRDRR